MNQEIKKLWVDALRSGEYEQGKMRLYTIFKKDGKEQHKYCCLGVLCDLFIKSDKNKEKYEWTKVFSGEDVTSCFLMGKFVYIPEIVIEWSEMSKDNNNSGIFLKEPIKPVKDSLGFFHLSLSSLNDDGFSFKQIADVIEKQF